MASQILIMLNLSSQVTIYQSKNYQSKWIPWDTVTHGRGSRHVWPLTINLLLQYLIVMHIHQELWLPGVIRG